MIYKRTQGRWVKMHKIGLEEVVACSVCDTYMLETKNGMKIPFVDIMRYCPMCGAEIERRADEHTDKRDRYAEHIKR